MSRTNQNPNRRRPLGQDLGWGEMEQAATGLGELEILMNKRSEHRLPVTENSPAGLVVTT